MSIELELSLEGENVNEDTLLDLIDWLERANIDGLEVNRKEFPSAKGDMGVLADTSTIIAVVSTVVALADIAVTVAGWRKGKKIEIDLILTNPDETLQENKDKIKELIAEIKGREHNDK